MFTRASPNTSQYICDNSMEIAGFAFVDGILWRRPSHQSHLSHGILQSRPCGLHGLALHHTRSRLGRVGCYIAEGSDFQGKEYLILNLAGQEGVYLLESTIFV